MSDPISSYIKENMEYFAGESKRLLDKGVLVEYWTLASRFLDVEQKLGTRDHEAALNMLAEDFVRARSAVLRDWSETWRSFFRWRSEIKRQDRMRHQSQEELKKILADMEGLALKNDASRSGAVAELNAHLESVMAIARESIGAPSNNFSGLPRAILLMDLRAFSIYLRYLLARCIFLLLRHSFIIFILVFVCGTLYSKGVAMLAEFAAQHVNTLAGKVALVVFVAAIAKRYLIDPWLKRLQIKIESRWLSKLALKLHFALVLELTSRTARRQPAEE